MNICKDSGKNPMLQEVFFNAANLEVIANMMGLADLYMPQVASRNKQLGEIEVLLKSIPVPNPQVEEATQKIEQMKMAGVDPQELAAAEQQVAAMPPEISSLPIDEKTDDNDTEAATCWQYINGQEGRRAKRSNPDGFKNVCLHYDEHAQAVQAKAAH